MMKKSTLVTIAGQGFSVKSSVDETHIRQLARYVDAQIEALKVNTGVVSTQKLAVLAALNISNELFEERRRLTELKNQVRERSKSVLAYLQREEKRLFGER